jgi:hypothetical protein
VARMIARSIKYTLDHKVSSVLILLMVIALIFTNAWRVSPPNAAQAAQNNVVAGKTAGAAPATTERYFQGQANYDSNMIWSVLSDDLKARAEANGSTQNDLQSQLDDAKAAGRQVDQINYIGNYDMQNGQSMQFYVATVSQSPTDPAPSPIFYVFTLDTDGKILDIQ